MARILTLFIEPVLCKVSGFGVQETQQGQRHNFQQPLEPKIEASADLINHQVLQPPVGIHFLFPEP
jgi:hypothetical protein